MIKRVLSFVLCLMILMSTVAFGASFTDVSKESHSWAYDAIYDMADKGIINGISATEFAPDVAVTKVQAMLLIARILGYNTTSVSDNINSIYSIYEEDLSSLTTIYKKELAYLIFREVFTVEEVLDTALEQPLSREEAALYITKAADGVEEMNKISVVVNSYADDADIQEVYRKAVYYVRDKELMNGTGDNNFSPKTNVTRAQMATLLYRMMQNIDITITKGTIDSVNVSQNTAKIFVVTKTYDIASDVQIRNRGEVIQAKDLYQGANAVVTMMDNKIISVDTFFEMPEIATTVDGEVRSVQTANKSIQLRNPDTTMVTTYELADNAVVIINGVDSSLANVRTGDYAVLGLSRYNKIVSLTVSDVNDELSDVTISDIIIDDTYVTLELKDALGNIEAYAINANNVSIKKNGTKVEFSSLGVGDKLSRVTLKYNRITAIEAFSEIKSTSGTISEILISSDSSITLMDGNVPSTFAIGKDTKFYVFGEAKTIYDLRLAQYAKVTLDGSTVSKIEVSTQAQNANATGVVQSVNTTANLVTVLNTDGSNVVIYVSNTKTKIIDNNSTSAVSKSLKDIKVGDTITCIGVLTNGVFEAQTIVITK